MSDTASSRKVQKNKATVQVKLSDGEMFEGHFFVAEGQRVTDLLNGDMQFLPFENLNGNVFVIRKDTIVRIIAKDGKAAEAAQVMPARGEDWGFRR